MARRTAWFIYGSSGLLHGALAFAAIVAPVAKRHEAVSIALAEQKKPKAAAPPDEAKPPPPPAARAARAKSAPAPRPQTPEPAQPPPEAAPAFTDLGLTMGNGGGSGMSVPQRSSALAAPAPNGTTTRKITALAPKAQDACDEPPIKPKPVTIVKPAYTEDARATQIEGVVRVEITIDATGRVVDARVLRGLGHGLDEAAVAAARQMTFEPGTRCGKASVATLSVGIRFALGS